MSQTNQEEELTQQEIQKLNEESSRFSLNRGFEFFTKNFNNLKGRFSINRKSEPVLETPSALQPKSHENFAPILSRNEEAYNYLKLRDEDENSKLHHAFERLNASDTKTVEEAFKKSTKFFRALDESNLSNENKLNVLYHRNYEGKMAHELVSNQLGKVAEAQINEKALNIIGKDDDALHTALSNGNYDLLKNISYAYLHNHEKSMGAIDQGTRQINSPNQEGSNIIDAIQQRLSSQEYPLSLNDKANLADTLDNFKTTIAIHEDYYQDINTDKNTEMQPVSYDLDADLMENLEIASKQIEPSLNSSPIIDNPILAVETSNQETYTNPKIAEKRAAAGINAMMDIMEPDLQTNELQARINTGEIVDYANDPTFQFIDSLSKYEEKAPVNQASARYLKEMEKEDAEMATYGPFIHGSSHADEDYVLELSDEDRLIQSYRQGLRAQFKAKKEAELNPPTAEQIAEKHQQRLQALAAKEQLAHAEKIEQLSTVDFGSNRNPTSKDMAQSQATFYKESSNVEVAMAEIQNRIESGNDQSQIKHYANLRISMFGRDDENRNFNQSLDKSLSQHNHQLFDIERGYSQAEKIFTAERQMTERHDADLRTFNQAREDRKLNGESYVRTVEEEHQMKKNNVEKQLFHYWKTDGDDLAQSKLLDCYSELRKFELENKIDIGIERDSLRPQARIYSEYQKEQVQQLQGEIANWKQEQEVSPSTQSEATEPKNELTLAQKIRNARKPTLEAPQAVEASIEVNTQTAKPQATVEHSEKPLSNQVETKNENKEELSKPNQHQQHYKDMSNNFDAQLQKMLDLRKIDRKTSYSHN